MWLDIKNKKIQKKQNKKKTNKITTKYSLPFEKYTFATFMGQDKRPTTNVTEENLLTYVMKSPNHGCRV